MTTVRVFRNLTASRKGQTPVYSILAREKGRRGWRTMAHASYVCLSQPSFKVSKAGVARIRATGRKQVAAVIEGQLEHWAGKRREGVAGAGDFLLECRIEEREGPNPEAPSLCRVRFNPYQMDEFQTPEGAPVLHAGVAYIGPAGVMVER